jgi:hypothetical protein
MRRGLVLTFALVFVLLVVGCGDDDGGEELTLEAYFQDVEDIRAAFNEEIDKLAEGLEGLDEAPDDEQLEALRTYYDDSEAAFGQAMDDLDALNPPEEAEESHDEFVSAGRDVLEESESLSEALADVETVDEANELFEDSPEIEEASGNFEAACNDLQSLATDEGVVADLGCGSD